MHAAHLTLLIVGGLGIAAIGTGMFAARLGAPVLLVFLGLGMLAGQDGPGGIRFEDFGFAYLVGSVALVAILIEAGLKTSASAVRRVFGPAFGLATLGVAITAAVVGAASVLVVGLSWPAGLLFGAVLAPTDAAALATVLRGAGLAVAPRVGDVLEVESGINDPVAVFLTVLLTEILLAPGHATLGHAALLLAEELGGGAAFGLAAGLLLRLAVRRLRARSNLHPVLLLAGGLALFGGAQLVHASGFLAVYLAALVVGEGWVVAGATGQAGTLDRTFEGFTWIAQIGLAVLLGLLVTPHDIVPLAGNALVLAATLVFVARPLAAAICLAPFHFTWRETLFVGWVGLRGGVPLYLAIIPVLERVPQSRVAFVAAFAIVLVSLAVQGWTVAPLARLLRIVQPSG